MCRDPSASEATMMRARTSAATAQAVAALVTLRALMSGPRLIGRAHLQRQDAGTNWASMEETMPSIRR